jgi:hypothetical protein
VPRVARRSRVVHDNVSADTARICDGCGVTDPPVMVPLAEPRPPTAAEAAIITALVAHTGNAALRAQAESVQVVSTCSCGCPSVGLRSNGPQLSTVDMLGLSGLGRDDWFAVRASHKGTDVVVHVLSGGLGELEVYAGDGVTVALPAPAGITGVEVY